MMLNGGIKLKKILFIIILLIVCIVISFCWNYQSTYTIKNNEISVTVSNVLVESLTLNDIMQFGIENSFYSCKLTKNELYEMSENIDKYKKIILNYNIKNLLDDIEYYDIEVIPMFQEELNNYVFKYNTSNGTYPIRVQPNIDRSLQQIIILKDSSISNEEIANMLSKENAELRCKIVDVNEKKGGQNKIIKYGKYNFKLN